MPDIWASKSLVPIVHIHVTFRRSRQKTYQVHVHVGEPECRDGDGVEGSCWLLVNLSILALLAVSAHGCHIFANTLLNKTC